MNKFKNDQNCKRKTTEWRRGYICEFTVSLGANRGSRTWTEVTMSGCDVNVQPPKTSGSQFLLLWKLLNEVLDNSSFRGVIQDHVESLFTADHVSFSQHMCRRYLNWEKPENSIMAKRRKCAETDEEEATTKKLKRAMTEVTRRAKTRVKNKDTGTKKKKLCCIQSKCF